MTMVPIYVGQCGNQIGSQFDQIRLETDQLKQENDNRDVQRKRKTRQNEASRSEKRTVKYRNSVMIDTEGKVVGKLVGIQGKTPTVRGQSKVIGSQPMREQNIILGKRGRGNNWALGYEGIGTEKILEQSMESIRKEAERCGMFNNLLLIHSLCGGTGGGFGSRLLETLRGEYRLEHIISCVVAPFITGDTPLQHYNALLSLTSLQKFSDAVLLFKNDMLSAHCASISSGSSSVECRRGPTAVSYTEMNKYVGQCLAGITTPTDTLTPVRGFGCDLELSEIVRSVCPQPNLKFLTANHLTRSTDDIKALCNSAVALTKKENMGTKSHSLSSIAILRGPSIEANTHVVLPAMEQRIRKELNSVSWNPFPVDYWLASQSLASSKAGSHSVTLVSNYSNIITYADHVWVKAKQMYEQRAYLHWYYKHGLSQEFFEEAFNTVDDIIHNYSEAVR